MRGGVQTVYISGPITGSLQAGCCFKKAQEWLSNQGHTVLNPMDIPEPQDNLKNEDLWVYYMKKALALLVDADSIYMLEGWEKSRGARMEFWIATELNIPVHYAHEDYKYV
jgi:hypothetical protein